MSLALGLLGTACDSGNTPMDIRGHDDADNVAERYELRLTGTRATNYEAAFASIREVTITADGKPLTVALQPTAQAMNLALADHSPLVAYFWLPSGSAAATVEVQARFDDFGAYQEQASGSAGALRFIPKPIHFRAPVSELKRHHHAVIQLSLEDSAAPAVRDSRLMLPNTVVSY
ncbi:hypothetical protein KRR26_20400 [Corallococcus sp. M34]|uniref:hypothetical protein n=1 Tax=Citreicoccus inhibens TaxID=2849499 RepID=UPI0011C42701|nr:hypothetical protein [Citreicoccus inhibens]MBU8897981.1 hypothetical protein [Citreicoccus inhibens]